MNYLLEYACKSERGNTRPINQDRFCCNGILNNKNIEHSNLTGILTIDSEYQPCALFGVFDGMGGLTNGEVAAQIAAELSYKYTDMNRGTLLDYCIEANQYIHTHAVKRGIHSTGTTAAIARFSLSAIELCNIGDSRIYIMYDGELIQISLDHTMYSFADSTLKKPPLLQYLGMSDGSRPIRPYSKIVRPERGLKLLICTDGLTDAVADSDIRNSFKSDNAESIAADLMNAASTSAISDNITLQVIIIK